MAERRRTKLTHMASVVLDEDERESAKALAANPENAEFKLGLDAQVSSKGAVDEVEPEEEADEDDETASDLFSNHGKIARWVGRRFAHSPTPGYMLIFMLAMFLWIMFTNLASGSRSPGVGLALFFTFNLVFLLLVFMLRALWAQILSVMYTENRVVPALNNLLDPDLPILIWTIIMHLFWQQQFVQVFDKMGAKTGYHRISFVPWSWPMQYIPDSSTNLLKLAIIVMVFWALRNLVVEIIMFRILLGFLTNFKDSVLLYLRSYALLRKLNANWIKLIPLNREASFVMEGDPMIQRANSINRTLTRKKSRYVTQAVEEAVIRHQVQKQRSDSPQLPPSNAPPIKPQISKWNSIMRPGQARRIERAYNVQYTGRELPSVLQRRNIRAIEQSDLANLLSITWIRCNPTVLFVHGERCELRSKKVTKAVARMLYAELLAFKEMLEAIDRDLQQTQERERQSSFQGLLSPVQIASPRQPEPRTENVRRGGSTLAGTGSPGAMQKSKSKMLAIDITQAPGAPYQKLGDRLAQQLGTKNDESKENDTDEAISSDESDILSEVSDRVPDLTAERRTDLYAWPAGRVRQTKQASVPQVFSDPPIDQAPKPIPHHKGRMSTLPVGNEMDSVSLSQLRRRPSSEVSVMPGGDYTAFDTDAKPMKFRGEAAHYADHEEESFQPGPITSEESETAVEHERLTSDAAQVVDPPPAPVEPTPAAPQLAPPAGHSPPHMTDQQLKDIAKAEIAAVQKVAPKEKAHLTKDFFQLFMAQSEVDDLMELMDPAKLGQVTEKMFVKGVLNVHGLRRQMATSLDAQKEIEVVFHRVATFFLTFIMVLGFLFIVGINANTIIVSGAAALSAGGVVLSFVYTDFIMSIILIVFLNPYSIGDGMMIDNEFMTVMRITTYFTEFMSGEGKIYYYSHRELSNKRIVNQSRSKNANFSLIIRVGDHMTVKQYRAFKKVINAYLESRPMEFKPPLFIHWLGFQPFRYIEIHMMAMHAEGWQSPSIWDSKSYWMAFVLRQCHIMGLSWRDEVNICDVNMKQAPEEKLVDTKEPPINPKVQFAGEHATYIDLTTPQGIANAARSIWAAPKWRKPSSPLLKRTSL